MKYVKSTKIEPVVVGYRASQGDTDAIYAYSVELKVKQRRRRNDGSRPQPMFWDFGQGKFRSLDTIMTDALTKRLVWKDGCLQVDRICVGAGGDELIVRIHRNTEVISSRTITIKEDESLTFEAG